MIKSSFLTLFYGSPFVVVKSWNRRYLNKSGNGDSDFSLEVL